MPLMIKLNRNVVRVYLCLDNDHFITVYMKYQCDDHILKRIEKTSEILHCSRRQLQRVLHELVEKDILIKLSKGVYCFKK